MIRNRIKELRWVDAAQLQDHPLNWRIHSGFQRDALGALLGQIGIATALLAYESEQYGGLTLIGGHLRKDLYTGTWPVLVLDVSDAEAEALLLGLDATAAMAEADEDILSDLLANLKADDATLAAMFDDLRQGLLVSFGYDPVDPWRPDDENDSDDDENSELQVVKDDVEGTDDHFITVRMRLPVPTAHRLFSLLALAPGVNQDEKMANLLLCATEALAQWFLARDHCRHKRNATRSASCWHRLISILAGWSATDSGVILMFVPGLIDLSHIPCCLSLAIAVLLLLPVMI